MIWDSEEEKKLKFGLEKDRGTCFCSRGAAMEPTPSKLCFSDVARFEQILNHVLSCSGGRGGSLSAKPASPSLLLSSASFYINLEETTFSLLQRGFIFFFFDCRYTLTPELSSHTSTFSRTQNTFSDTS